MLKTLTDEVDMVSSIDSFSLLSKKSLVHLLAVIWHLQEAPFKKGAPSTTTAGEILILVREPRAL